MKYLVALCALCFTLAFVGVAYADDVSNFKLKDLDGKKPLRSKICWTTAKSWSSTSGASAASLATS